jgi:lipoprotein NlpD
MKRVLLLAGLLSGCIPPNPSMREPAPHIEDETPTSLIDEIPVWESRPVTALADAVTGGPYTVVAGDTLSAISVRTGTSLAALAQENNLEHPYALRIGQQISIPSGRFHTVQAGETGIAISRAYGTGWAQIVALNKLEEPFVLKVGQVIRLPTASLPNEATPETRAAAFKLDIDDILTGGEPASEPTQVATPAAMPSKPLPPSIAVREPASFSGGFGWPARGRIATRFGPGGAGEINQGIEISVPQNAPILASAGGTIAFVGSNVAGYGGLILIRHGNGWITAYGRAATATVTRGQVVNKGDIIGRSGSGATPLLHFEIRQKRTPVDPLSKLPATSG